MDYTTLGRTGLKVSVMGLGCGGPSRLGTLTGCGKDDAMAVVHRALDLGINLIDTAPLYETEGVVGSAIEGRGRELVVLSTKVWIFEGAEGAFFFEKVGALLDSKMLLPLRVVIYS